MPDRIERPRFCSQCGHPVVVADANFCKECGAALAATVWFTRDIARRRPSRAFILSIVPGLGHWYKGHGRRGVAWFIGVTFAYVLNPGLGLLFHAICAFSAAFSGATNARALVPGIPGGGANGFSAVVKQRT